MAYALGVTFIADSYDIANTLPNMVFELLAGGVLSSVFIPLFMERLQTSGEKDAWRFASYVLNIIVVVLGVVALLATIWPEPLVRSQTLTIPAERAELAVWLFRFFAVQIVFYGIGLVFTGILNSYRRFLAPAIAPVFNNLVVIVTLLGFYVPFRDSDPQLALTSLAVGTTLGVVAMTVAQLPGLVKLGWKYTPRIDLNHPGLRKVFVKMLPTLVYTITNLVAVTVRTNFAVATGEGGQAALRYAWQFYQLPYGIFAVALATAIFPELAERANAKNMEGFRSMFSKGLRTTMVLIMPLAALMATLSTPIITLYRAGRFTDSDVPLVAAVLLCWSVALIFFAAYMFVLKTFYSLQDTATPMYTNLATTIIHVGLYALLTTGFGTWAGLGIIGVPIADGVFYLVHTAVLMVILRRKIGGFGARTLVSTFARVAIAAIAGSVVAWGAVHLTSALATHPGGFIVQLAIALLAGLAVTYGAMAALRVPEFRETVARLTARFRRGKAAS